MIARLRDRPMLTALLLAIAAQLLFTIHLGQPARLVFDESHYVAAARVLLALEQPWNTEHPLLGKALIALGIAGFGDNPVGWRAASTLAGTLSVLAIYALLWLTYRRVRTAALGALLAMLNQLLFVHARTGMLEAFLGAFVMLAAAALLWALQARRPRVAAILLGVAAILCGLAVAVKWAAIPYVAMGCAVLVACAVQDRTLRTRRPGARFGGMPLAASLALLGGVSIATYLLTFAPAFFYARDPLTLARLIPFQLDMYRQQTQILAPHTYQSRWWQWPLILRPIWYFYEPDIDGVQRGVLLVGNPAIMWGGLIAVAAGLWAGARERWLALAWIASLAIWIVIPKSLGFYYYYHLSALILCAVLAGVFHRFARGRRREIDFLFVALSAVLFAWFYPILSGAALPDARGFEKWMWFDSWR
ncbi:MULTISPECIES: phospholipid carrier-dependent glycosyltransferase [unclassified Sphingomonas]|uniref:phospholipid carrier-dependent glycosyltransferase n=1 Tax=unclassified Sphingomonas TaxID=196159 RepID=UPI0008327033|nr:MULTISPECIES: phospholipid carrier-dependent glycosyltransferase [unclassified Sphingomonas]